MMCAVKINRIGKFDLNPRGNLWAKDENRFGHKLMSKMGWSQGKGLGKNEDGIKENLKVKVKTEHSGIGWTEKFPLAVETAEYDAVLANLNAKFNNSPKNKFNEETTRSIEERSQEFKKRIHYGKFVRGKDVGRYSEKDFNSIFVTKMPKLEPKTVEETTVTNVECPSDNSGTMTTFKSSLSMKDYFEMKMKKQKVENITSSAENMEIDESDSQMKELSSKKNKKRKHESDTEESSNEEYFQVLSLINSKTDSNSQEQMSTIKKSKKSSVKSKKLKKDSDCEEESSNTSVGNNEGSLAITKCDSIFTENDTIDNTVKKRKPKKGSEKSKKLNLGSDLEELSNTFENDIRSVEASQCKNNISESNININTTENVESSEVNKVKKKRKHKKFKAEVDLADESTSPDSSANEKEFQNGDAEESVLPEELSVSKKLKAKKSKKSILLKGLKTCLKTIGTYAVERESRRVSFSEQVHCRMLTTYLDEGETEESKSEINDVVLPCVNKEAMSNESEESVESSENPVEKIETTQCEDSKKVVEDHKEEEEDSTPNCMDLPKGDNSNYNSWLENQRIATKMKLYKGMVKKIKKHPVLKTSNLLDLKGYGNWGF